MRFLTVTLRKIITRKCNLCIPYMPMGVKEPHCATPQNQISLVEKRKSRKTHEVEGKCVPLY